MRLDLIEKETCPRCGARFDCSKSGKCWCYEVSIKPSLLEKIQQTYDSCLCPSCLTDLANVKT